MCIANCKVESLVPLCSCSTWFCPNTFTISYKLLLIIQFPWPSIISKSGSQDRTRETFEMCSVCPLAGCDGGRWTVANGRWVWRRGWTAYHEAGEHPVRCCKFIGPWQPRLLRFAHHGRPQLMGGWRASGGAQCGWSSWRPGSWRGRWTSTRQHALQPGLRQEISGSEPVIETVCSISNRSHQYLVPASEWASKRVRVPHSVGRMPPRFKPPVFTL